MTFWDKYQNTTIKPFLQNDTFEGIVGNNEFIILKQNGLLDLNSVLISIKDPNDKPHPKELLSFKDVIEISFYDTEDTDGSYATLSQTQAQELAMFILKNKDNRFLIHCRAGMSRSAGVAKVVELVKLFDCDRYFQATSKSDIDDFTDDSGLKRYFPNLTVQRIITDEILKLC